MKQGFTLIELSIVLVIIGLIIGGVLVGRDLISAAEIRKTVSQIEQVKTAVHTFRTKYNAVPGDITPQEALAFGLADGGGPLGRRGNNDGYINGPLSNVLEYAGFWFNLQMAGLIATGCISSSDYGDNGAAGTTQTELLSCFLNSKAGRNAVFLVYGGPRPPGTTSTFDFSSNRIVLAGVSNIPVWTHAFSPPMVYALDSKTDDGLPMTGVVKATGAQLIGDFMSWLHNGTDAVSAGAGGAASAVCVNNTTTPNSYNLPNNDLLCTVAVEPAGF